MLHEKGLKGLEDKSSDICLGPYAQLVCLMDELHSQRLVGKNCFGTKRHILRSNYGNKGEMDGGFCVGVNK